MIPSSALSGPQGKASAKVLLLIAAVWALTRLLAWMHYDPQLSWDVWEARKLHEYGFWNRMGALLHINVLNGMVSDPAQFNYVDHPAGPIWIYYLIEAVAGSYGIIIFCALAGLAGCLLTHRVLLRFYDANTALFGALLYTVAPTAIFFDADPNVVALGAVFWPLSFYLATQPGVAIRKKAWLLCLTVFVAGQVTWFSWMIYPALLLLTAHDEEPVFRQLRKPFKNPLWVALTIGLVLTMAGYCAQVVGYTSDLKAALGYAFNHIHPEGFGPSRLEMARFILIKSSLVLSPALFFGSFAGMALVWRQKGRDRLAGAATVGLACTMIAATVLVRFYYREHNGYRFALFPVTLLTANFLHRASFRWLKVLAAALSLVGLGYAQFRVSAPASSMASAMLAREVSHRFDPYALVFANLRERRPPFPAWEPFSSGTVNMAADRHFYMNYDSMEKLLHALAEFSAQPKQPPVFYLVDPGQPLAEGLRTYLATQARRLDDWTMAFPPEKPNLPAQLRSLYWRLTKSPFASEAGGENQQARSLTLEVYQLPTQWPEAKE